MNLAIRLLSAGAVCCITTLGALSAFGCYAGPAIKGSGVSKTETREVAPFKNIRIVGSADVTVDTGPTQKQSLSIEADDNILPVLDTTVKGDTLVISTKESVSPKVGIKAKITLPEFTGVQIDGSGKVVGKGIAGKSFDVNIQGSGDVTLNGSSDALHVTVSGSGEVDTTQLTSATADVHINGAGDVRVNATDTLDAHISGAGDIRYTGTPKVTKHIAGAGSIRKM